MKRVRLPTIIAIYAVAEGVTHGVASFAAYPWWDSILSLLLPRTMNELGYAVMCLTSVVFVAVSYFVFRGRDWARRVLMWTSVAMGLAMVMGHWGHWYHSSSTFDWRWLSTFLAFLSSPFFLAAALNHSTVAATFQVERPPDATNAI